MISTDGDKLSLRCRSCPAGKLALGVAVLAVSISVTVCVSVIFFITKKVTRKLPSLLESTTVARYSYRDLETAAHGFDEKDKVGEGRCSIVYRGTLADGSAVAIKKLKAGLKKEAAFSMEIAIISRISHQNLLSLQGWCYEEGEALLVYEYMPKILHHYLFAGSKKGSLNSMARFRIVKGLGAALAYLHENCILHRDVKAANVSLTEEFEPMLGDFGVARLIAQKRGRLPACCVAPEVAHTRRATQKADVYSFGILALELASGRPAMDGSLQSQQICLIEWVWLLHQSNKLMDALDPSMHDLHGALSMDEEMQWRCVLHMALMCCHPLLEARPSMQEATQVLHETKIMPLPAYMPTCPSLTSGPTLAPV